MEIHFGSDHRGYELKRQLIDHLTGLGHHCTDHGCTGTGRVDYPDFAPPACAPLVGDPDDTLAVLVCGSGIGISIAANKLPGVRCVVAWCEHVAEYGRRHNHANALAFSGDLQTFTAAQRCIDAFLAAEREGGRHAQRVEMLGRLD